LQGSQLVAEGHILEATSWWPRQAMVIARRSSNVNSNTSRSCRQWLLKATPAKQRQHSGERQALNHPHIAAIYGLEDAAGITALAMEFVDGDDLAHRLTRGPMPLDEALSIACGSPKDGPHVIGAH
jgi:hypothetical protein